jgi:hypothetical protein
VNSNHRAQPGGPPFILQAERRHFILKHHPAPDEPGIFSRSKMELSKGTKGSLAELRVSCHLIGLGFYVFKNLSVNGPCDLVAIKGRGRQTIRVQVKSTLGMNQFKNLRQGGNDLLAVLVDGEIRYRAMTRRVASLVPGCILARRPKKRH